MVDPAQEWKQIFTDAWRLQRDYFYDPGMHGIDWQQMRQRYSKMLDGAMTREEANFVLGEMIGELNASHTYYGGGDLERTKSQSTGYLGIDWQADGAHYKIKKIIAGRNGMPKPDRHLICPVSTSRKAHTFWRERCTADHRAGAFCSL
jgi:tricorn protease